MCRCRRLNCWSLTSKNANFTLISLEQCRTGLLAPLNQTTAVCLVHEHQRGRNALLASDRRHLAIITVAEDKVKVESKSWNIARLKLPYTRVLELSTCIRLITGKGAINRETDSAKKKQIFEIFASFAEALLEITVCRRFRERWVCRKQRLKKWTCCCFYRFATIQKLKEENVKQ